MSIFGRCILDSYVGLYIFGIAFSILIKNTWFKLVLTLLNTSSCLSPVLNMITDHILVWRCEFRIKFLFLTGVIIFLQTRFANRFCCNPTYSYLQLFSLYIIKIEPRREKTCLRGFRPGATQIGLYSHRSRLDA